MAVLEISGIDDELKDKLSNIISSVDKKSSVEDTYILNVTKNNNSVKMRIATKADTSLVLDFIKNLAQFEKLEDQVTATVPQLESALYPLDDEKKKSSEKGSAKVIILEVDNIPAGFVLYFYNFSTFVGKYGIYVEDLFVREEYRRNGYGKLLLQTVCQIAKEKDCGRVEWWVLNWNERAINFYKSLGAVPMDEWTVYRLTKDTIDKIAAQE